MQKAKENGLKQGKVASAIARHDDGTVQLTITIPRNLVEGKRNEALEHIIANLDMPGFRKGKAPKDVAEKKINEQELWEHTLQHLLPEVYSDAVEDHNLKPILAPKFQLSKANPGEDWEVIVTTCEYPEVDLGNYEETVRKNIKSADIWVPGKDEQKREVTQEEKQQRVIKALLESVDLQIPKPLVEEEVNHKMARLVQQTEKLGLSVEQYLSSTGQNVEQVRERYASEAEQAIKLELILNKVAEEKDLKATDEEVETMIAATGDEQTQKALSTPQQKEMIRKIIERNKALKELEALAS